MSEKIMDCGIRYIGKAHLEEIDDRLIGSCQHCGSQFNVSATPISTNDVAGFMAFLLSRALAISDADAPCTWSDTGNGTWRSADHHDPHAP